jgi:hypothetical protein
VKCVILPGENVAEDAHLLNVLRYSERNPLRGGLVSRAADWRWSSQGQVCQNLQGPPVDAGPVARPANWFTLVDLADTEAELLALRTSVLRDAPFGTEAWQTETARRLGLESSLRPLGRPVKLREIKRDEQQKKGNTVESTPDPFSDPDWFAPGLSLPSNLVASKVLFFDTRGNVGRSNHLIPLPYICQQPK